MPLVVSSVKAIRPAAWDCWRSLRERRGEGEEGGGGGTHIIHDRSRIPIDPRIPANAGTELVGFSPTKEGVGREEGGRA